MRELHADGSTSDCRRPPISRLVCKRHYRRAQKKPEAFAGILEPMSSEKKALLEEGELVLKRVGQPFPGRCRVREVMGMDELPCPRSPGSRGVCSHHRALLKPYPKLFERIASASRRRPVRLEVDGTAPVDRCRTLVDGEPCSRPARPLGLCTKHYQSIWARPDLELEDFVLPVEVGYQLRGRIVSGECRVRERRAGARPTDCTRRALARGLCKRHYHRWQKEPAEFQGIALETERRLTRRHHPPLGACEVAENGVGCSQRGSRTRGVCPRHKQMLRTRGLLDELFPPKARRTPKLTKRADAAIREDECVAVRDGVPCNRAPHWRGLCPACIYWAKKTGVPFETLLLPSKRDSPGRSLDLRPRLFAGLCRVSEDGVPCERPSSIRGLCDSHYNLGQAQGRLSELALPRTRGGGEPPLPHQQLAPDILVDFGVFRLAGYVEEPDSVRLLDEVLAGRRRATVTTLALRAAYSRLGHRLARTEEEGGMGLEPVTAEARSRGFLRMLLGSRMACFHVMRVELGDLRRVVAGELLPELIPEDALELASFARARASLQPDFLVTRDPDLLEHGQGLTIHPGELLDLRPRRKARLAPGLCVVRDGQGNCPEPRGSRGLCQLHRTRLAKAGRIDEVALPPVDKAFDLSVQEEPRRGLCRVAVDGNPCPVKARRNGLCKRHYQLVFSNHGERLEEFVRPPVEKLYERRKGRTTGQCRIREVLPEGGGNVLCRNRPERRGLCGAHCEELAAYPWLLEQLADLPEGEPRLVPKEEPEEGTCLVVEARVPCTMPVRGRARVCPHHLRALGREGLRSSWQELLEPPPYVLAGKDAGMRLPGTCGIVVNGVPCPAPAKDGEVCPRCRARADAIGQPLPTILAPVESGAPGAGSADEGGEVASEIRLGSEAGEEPVFLDKNVIIDHVRGLLGWKPSVSNSVELVRRALDGKVTAVVSADCPRAVLAWLGRELEIQEGLDRREAVARARHSVHQLFFSKEARWQVSRPSRERFLACFDPGELPDLSLEDAWELEAARAARNEPGGPPLIVTADFGFLSAVPSETLHPRHFSDAGRSRGSSS